MIPAIGSTVSFVRPDRHPSFLNRYTGKVVEIVDGREPIAVIEVETFYVWHPDHPENGREMIYMSGPVAELISELEVL